MYFALLLIYVEAEVLSCHQSSLHVMLSANENDRAFPFFSREKPLEIIGRTIDSSLPSVRWDAVLRFSGRKASTTKPLTTVTEPLSHQN